MKLSPAPLDAAAEGGIGRRNGLGHDAEAEADTDDQLPAAWDRA
jgi:hypothetical protein